MSNMQRIVGQLTNQFKAESIVEPFGALSANCTSEVRYVLAHPKPPLTVLLGTSFRHHNGLHAVVKERIRLEKVDNIEGNLHILRKIAYCKVKPLSIATGVYVVLQHQVVLCWRFLKLSAAIL